MPHIALPICIVVCHVLKIHYKWPNSNGISVDALHSTVKRLWFSMVANKVKRTSNVQMLETQKQCRNKNIQTLANKCETINYTNTRKHKPRNKCKREMLQFHETKQSSILFFILIWNYNILSLNKTPCRSTSPKAEQTLFFLLLLPSADVEGLAPQDWGLRMSAPSGLAHLCSIYWIFVMQLFLGFACFLVFSQF